MGVVEGVGVGFGGVHMVAVGDSNNNCTYNGTLANTKLAFRA